MLSAMWPWLRSCTRCLERSVRVVEPFLAMTAVLLVLLDAYVFFTSVIFEIYHASGKSAAMLHTVWAAFLLFNVLFNHVMCVFTPPGCTKDFETQALQRVMTFEWHWCLRCNHPKPPLAHHCSICNRCILKLDHHCVWMANCIGWGNYKYFFLYLFYMWVGSLYTLVVMVLYAPAWLFDLDDGAAAAMAPTHEQLVLWDLHVKARPVSLWSTTPGSFLPFLVFILAAAVFIALCVLLGWHVWLVLTGQGTIDFMQNAAKLKEAKGRSETWSNPYNQGPASNWREAFDASGSMWWLTWAAPSARSKRGCGYLPPNRHHHAEV